MKYKNILYIDYTSTLMHHIKESFSNLFYFFNSISHQLTVLVLCGISLAPYNVIARNNNVSDHISFEELLKYSIEDLLDINITTASKFQEKSYEAPSVVSVITENDILKYGANKLVDILARVPGLYMTGTYAFNQNVISIRGDQSIHYNHRVLLLLNGRPFRDTIWGGKDENFLSGFPISLIQRIEIIRGPGSVLYGSNASNGVINVITKPTTENTSGTIKVTTGSFEGRGVEATGHRTLGDLDIVGGFYGFKNTGWEKTATDEVGTTGNVNYSEDHLNIFGQLLYKNFSANTFISTRKQTDFGATTHFPFLTRDVDRYLVDIGYSMTLSQEWSADINLTYNRFEQLFPSGGEILKILAESRLIDTSVIYTPSENFNFVTGLQADNHKGFYGKIDPLKLHIPPYDEWWYQAYAQASWWPKQDLKLVLGAQLNKIENNDAVTVPRAAIIYSFNNRWHIKLLSGQAYRGPNSLERNVVVPGPVIGDPLTLIGNPMLNSETVKTTEFQINHHQSNITASLAAFISNQKDQITRSGSSPVSFINTGRIKFKGMELEMKYSPIESLDIDTSYLHQTNERLDGVKNSTLIPNDIWKIGASYRSKLGVTAGIFNTHIGKAQDNVILNPTRSLVNPQAKSYNDLSLNITFDLNKLANLNKKYNPSFSLYTTNLLDEDVYTPEIGRKKINTVPLVAGRAVFASFNMEF